MTIGLLGNVDDAKKLGQADLDYCCERVAIGAPVREN
jgi:hypothetical protein